LWIILRHGKSQRHDHKLCPENAPDSCSRLSHFFGFPPRFGVVLKLPWRLPECVTMISSSRRSLWPALCKNLSHSGRFMSFVLRRFCMRNLLDEVFMEPLCTLRPIPEGTSKPLRLCYGTKLTNFHSRRAKLTIDGPQIKCRPICSTFCSPFIIFRLLCFAYVGSDDERGEIAREMKNNFDVVSDFPPLPPHTPRRLSQRRSWKFHVLLGVSSELPSGPKATQ
jgi:hypothetical protein